MDSPGGLGGLGHRYGPGAPPPCGDTSPNQAASPLIPSELPSHVDVDMSHLLHASGVNYLQAQPRDPAPHTFVQNTSSIFHSAPDAVAITADASAPAAAIALQQLQL